MPSIDFPTLKLLVKMSDVLRVIGWRPATREGEELRGPCPLHKSHAPNVRSLAISEDGFYCHVCKRHGDQLRLYAEWSHLGIYEACIVLAARVGVAVPYLPRSRHRNRKRNGKGGAGGNPPH